MAGVTLRDGVITTIKEEVPEEDLSQVKACSLDEPDCESCQ